MARIVFQVDCSRNGTFRAATTSFRPDLSIRIVLIPSGTNRVVELSSPRSPPRLRLLGQRAVFECPSADLCVAGGDLGLRSSRRVSPRADRTLRTLGLSIETFIDDFTESTNVARPMPCATSLEMLPTRRWQVSTKREAPDPRDAWKVAQLRNDPLRSFVDSSAVLVAVRDRRGGTRLSVTDHARSASSLRSQACART